MKNLLKLPALGLFALMITGCFTTGPKYSKQVSEIRGLVIAVHMYAEDHEGVLPVNWQIMKPYILGKVDTNDYELLVRGKMTDHSKPAEVILLQQKLANNKGEWLVAYMDGHIEIHQSDSVEAIPLPKRKKNSRY